MPIYRKKPAPVEARLFMAYTQGPELIEWIKENGEHAYMAGSWSDLTDKGPAYMLIGEHGNLRADAGDYILKDGDGRISVRTAEDFNRVYERVEG